MPHKVNAAKRQGAPQTKRRVRNWKAYDAALRQRGSLTIWFTQEAIAAWATEPRTTPDGQPRYSAMAVTTALTLRAVFHLALHQTEVYAKVLRRDPDAKVVVPPRSDAVPSDTADTAPTQRDRHIHDIAAKGRSGWQAARKYNRRALVEAQIGRYKTVIGEALRSHTDEAQATEVAIAAIVLNQMRGLGRPESVRVA